VHGVGAEPETIVIDYDGRRIVTLDWGGDGPPLLMLHPNGFCAGVWDPLARALRPDFRPLAVDLRGHGASDPPRSPGEYSFTGAARDVGEVLDAIGIDQVVALGHSMGGACTILLDQVRPGLVSRALLCEAIAFPRRPERLGQGVDGNVMAEAARRRRGVWPERDTVRVSYASRPPLDVLEAEVLDAYVRWGFRDRPDGEVELSCPPDVEAGFFEAATKPDGAAAAFAHLPALAGRATVVCGTRTNLPREFFAAQANAVDTPLLEIDGSHFLLQEDTPRAAALVREHLA
jgi:pimeloyl-ACP methyl ester carboxylesterase